MKIKCSVKRNGGSLALYIPKVVSDKFKLKENHEILIEIITNLTPESVRYICTKDKHVFDTDDIPAYCPICGEEYALMEVNKLPIKTRKQYGL